MRLSHRPGIEYPQSRPGVRKEGDTMAHNPHTIPAPDGSGLDAPLPVPAGDLLIDGQWLPATSGERREQIDPSNGRPLASIAIGGPTDIDQAIASSAAA